MIMFIVIIFFKLSLVFFIVSGIMVVFFLFSNKLIFYWCVCYEGEIINFYCYIEENGGIF